MFGVSDILGIKKETGVTGFQNVTKANGCNAKTANVSKLTLLLTCAILTYRYVTLEVKSFVSSRTKKTRCRVDADRSDVFQPVSSIPPVPYT
jgi:hypothetical protein